MSDDLPKPLGFSPKAGDAIMMAVRAEARALVELIAGPLRMGENVKAALTRVARTTDIGDRRVRAIWHGEARSIRADEMDRLRKAARDAREVEMARDEYRTFVARLSACDTALGLPATDDRRSMDHDGLGLARPQDRPLAPGR